MTILEFVFDSGMEPTGNNEFRKLLQRLIKDTPLPQGAAPETPGRDAQFELFIAALCRYAGLAPVKIEEPDITCHLGDDKIAIAAKRLKSHKQVGKHLRKAASQISATGLPGVIALEVSMLLNSQNLRVIGMSDRTFEQYRNQAIRQFIEGFDESLAKAVGGKGVMGMVIHDFQIRRVSNGWELGGFTMTYNLAKTTKHKNCFDGFERSYKRALPNVNST